MNIKNDGEYLKDKTFSVPHHGNYNLLTTTVLLYYYWIIVVNVNSNLDFKSLDSVEYKGLWELRIKFSSNNIKIIAY